MTINPKHPRYIAQMLPTELRQAQCIWGIFDTFTQSFVTGPSGYEPKFSTEAAAQRNAAQMSRAYERGQINVD